MMPINESSPSSVFADEVDPRVDATIKAINWETLLAFACPYPIQFAHWGDQISGGYNLVRFLHRIHDTQPDTVVVRVPLRPTKELTVEHYEALCSRLASEVATMQYIEAYTPIPVPHIIHYNAEASGGGAGSPYIIMSKVEGSHLSSAWREMEDDKRDAVLRQAVDIYLELSSHRFDKIGALFKNDGVGKDAWYLKPLSFITDPDEHSPSLSTMYSSGSDYWIAYANANLEKISNEKFGSGNKAYEYAFLWVLRSFIPSLYDNSLDAAGFPLIPGDFHSQNIMVTNIDSDPRIVGVIDWEFSSTGATSSFAQYPKFIVDHPQWGDDHPLRSRNARDQAKFDAFMNEAERRRNPDGDHRLSNAFANCHNIYLFEQCIQYPIYSTVLYPLLFANVYGEDEDLSTDYYWGLMEHGLLKKQTKRFKTEEEVWNEVSRLLGDEVAGENFTRETLKDFVLKNRSRFPVGSKVLEWVAAEDKLTT